MPGSATDTTAAAYALEARAWLALEGRIPGHPLHDAAAWAAWRSALHAASKASAENGWASAPSGAQQDHPLA
jgi:hypothetical protein